MAGSETSSAIGAGDEPAAECAQCGGAGFVRIERPVGHPRFGKAEPCACVLGEAEADRQARLQRISNLGPLAMITFALLADDTGDARLPAEALERAAAYAREAEGWLVVTGPSGSGKTRLAAAVANARIADGHPALFTDVLDLLDHLRAGFEPEDGEPGFVRLFEQVRNAPFLVLDGIDAGTVSAWAKEKLFQLVNHRYSNRLPTVITSAAPLAALEDRLATRLGDAGLARQIRLQAAPRERYRQVGGMTRERLADYQFRNFDLSRHGLSEEEWFSLEAAFNAAQGFAERLDGIVTIGGRNGCGKTHLACAIANKVLAAGTDVFFAVVPDLLDELRATFSPQNDRNEYADFFATIRNAGLLVLDDLGAQRSASWAEEKLFQIVNYRAVAGLPTVITTDRSWDELEAAHPRLFARIADSRIGSFIPILAPHYLLGRSRAPAPEKRKRGGLL